MKRFFSLFEAFTKRIAIDNVSAYAAQSAFFIILSIFPFILVLLNILSFTRFSPDSLLNSIENYVPDSLIPFIHSIFTDMRTKSSNFILSLTIITAIWSSSKGIFALTHGLNNAYHIQETRNYFKVRFLSYLYTILFAIAIITTLGLEVFGSSFYEWANTKFQPLFDLAVFVKSIKITGTIFLLIICFLLIYSILPNKHISLIYDLPGAVFASIGWVFISNISSLYIHNLNSLSYIYGSMSSIILLMLWLNLCMYIIIIGAEFNAIFYEHRMTKLEQPINYERKPELQHKNHLYTKHFSKFLKIKK